MRTLPLLVLPLPLSVFPHPPPRTSTQTHVVSNPVLYQPLSASLNSRNKAIAFGVNPSDSKEPLFLDENGVVDDMEGYLNHLSLEYDSVWDTKPSWSALYLLSISYSVFFFASHHLQIVISAIYCIVCGPIVQNSHFLRQITT